MIDYRQKVFAEKAQTYILCYNEQCPLHTKCLHYDVGQCVSPTQRLVTAVSPKNEHVADGKCELFTQNTPTKMPVGMKNHFYNDMPARIAVRVKKRLIAHNCRATYYKYHNGTQPIPPAMLEFIKRVCREEGWKGSLVFDGETEDLVW